MVAGEAASPAVNRFSDDGYVAGKFFLSKKQFETREDFSSPSPTKTKHSY